MRRWVVSHIPKAVCDAVAITRGWQDGSGQSLWDFMEPEEFEVRKSYVSDPEACRAARALVDQDVFAAVRVYEQEGHRGLGGKIEWTSLRMWEIGEVSRSWPQGAWLGQPDHVYEEGDDE